MKDSQFWRRIGAQFETLISRDQHTLVWGYSLITKKYNLTIIGGDELALEKFNVLVVRAGRKLDANDPKYAWLSLLAMTGRSHSRTQIQQYDPTLDIDGPVNTGVLDNLAKCSATHCARLEAAALMIDGWKGNAIPQIPIASAPVPKHHPESTSGLLNRAAWLQSRLDERSTKSRLWDGNWIEDNGGPDHKTTKKILDGKPVTRKPLKKLMMALNTHKTLNRVKFSDIPND